MQLSGTSKMRYNGCGHSPSDQTGILLTHVLRNTDMLARIDEHQTSSAARLDRIEGRLEHGDRRFDIQDRALGEIQRALAAVTPRSLLLTRLTLACRTLKDLAEAVTSLKEWLVGAIGVATMVGVIVEPARLKGWLMAFAAILK